MNVLIKCYKEKINGKSKPLALTKSFPKKCRNLKIRYGRGNVRSGKCLSREMSSGRNVLRGSVRSGNCPFGEMSVGEVSVGEMSVGDLSSGKCQSGKRPVGKLSYNRSEVFCKKGVLSNFVKFSGKHLCQSLFFN